MGLFSTFNNVFAKSFVKFFVQLTSIKRFFVVASLTFITKVGVPQIEMVQNRPSIPTMAVCHLSFNKKRWYGRATMPRACQLEKKACNR